MASEQSYDFIVVGSGPAGCAVASQLAQSAKKPSVLLLEAGGPNDDNSLRVDGKRWQTFTQEGMNWGYKTVAQKHLNGRELDYSRGKGLGGSSAINFGVYAVGARDDYDEWASVVGDDTFSWKNIQTRFKKLETFNGTFDVAENQKYASPKASDHGTEGVLGVGYAKEWDQDLPLVLDAFEQAGFPKNEDHNSGNPIGMGLCINSCRNGVRSTAADLLLGHTNLVIVTNSPVSRVIMKGKRAVGVEANGQQYHASKEIIISAGSLDTPKILMHSGIGPADQLSKFNIPVIHDSPAVGQGLRDHIFAPVIVTRNPATNDRNAFFKDTGAMSAATTQWQKDNTGPWARYNCQICIGWLKSDNLTSLPEFKALPPSVQEFMNRETIPHYEMINFPIHNAYPDMFQDYSYLCLAVMMMNEQSIGEVRLQSSNPSEPLLFDPKFLEHPFDRKASIVIYKHLMEVVNHPSFAKDTVSTMLGAASDSDEDILEFWRNNISSTWHMTGTAKMGKVGDADAVVDHRFRVIGVDGLRVADMSCVPVLTNNHTQATAYVTGATAADVLLEEYGLAEITK
ncbi:hypothetical protein N7448_009967 [Penicillium atrosanguineum]|uniref:Uncharacterized protein n=1 Tax=Penicillium atrosanguineum TaxID=1132637 RepID=A0A9W9TZR3_9EURO|nr:Mediator complex subunit Med17 [Penicillium atrosanguineum]KAJ5119298.1 hypothetical protein N7448_009967 [Penicillium atrosanguineum]KAJ5296289.1 Mediator complex subunit Med17 [Penicillium atrosanguineum]KAJ5299059.1 hypothetical protein N7476_010616 [Penicillium atrosanguineum]